MKLDFHDGILTAVGVLLAGAVLTVLSGIRALGQNRKITYYHLRRVRVAEGYFTIAGGLVLAGLAFLLAQYGEPMVYAYFPPSQTFTRTATSSSTATISLTPTITPTTTISLTPAASYSPTASRTPYLPEAIRIQFTGSVTPDPDAVFSPLQFSRSIANYQAVDPGTAFENPLGRLFVSYSYDHLADGVQWTMLLERDGELIAFQTGPWQSGTGGYEYDELLPPAGDWLPGTYLVTMFVGEQWSISGEFVVTGDPPTRTPTPSPSATTSRTLTPSVTRTPSPTRTLRPSDTRWPTPTR